MTTIAIIIILILLTIGGVNDSEKIECRKLEKYSKEFPIYNYKTGVGFYITKWQDEMCKSHEINIKAAVL